MENFKKILKKDFKKIYPNSIHGFWGNLFEKIRCAKLSSVDEDEYGEEGLLRMDVGYKFGDYKTLRFLGSGGYATIWLVKNKAERTYEALKITKSYIGDREKAEKEADFMEYMMKMGTHRNIVDFLGGFQITVEDACHLVMRYEVMGPNLYDIIDYKTKFHPDVVRKMIKHLLKAVEYIHRQHIIHMDIKTENMMFEISHEDIRDMAKSTDTTHNIYHLDLTRANSKFTLKLADFGLACIIGPSNEKADPPASPFRPPESVLTLTVDFPIDMWSVGCTIYEIVTRKQLLSCTPEDNDSYRLLHKLAKLLGPIPKAPFTIRTRPDALSVFGDDDCIHQGNPNVRRNFANAARKYLNDDDSEAFAKFLIQFFEYDPKKRVTAKEALKNWFIVPKGDQSIRENEVICLSKLTYNIHFSVNKTSESAFSYAIENSQLLAVFVCQRENSIQGQPLS
uniref:Protein kinase domain-containing protein n=1 Tax=Caenorhabditis tropicalis TaxID=1561998 RepID=A0A1I7U1W9_9PELO